MHACVFQFFCLCLSPCPCLRASLCLPPSVSTLSIYIHARACVCRALWAGGGGGPPGHLAAKRRDPRACDKSRSGQQKHGEVSGKLPSTFDLADSLFEPTSFASPLEVSRMILSADVAVLAAAVAGCTAPGAWGCAGTATYAGAAACHNSIDLALVLCNLVRSCDAAPTRGIRSLSSHARNS